MQIRFTSAKLLTIVLSLIFAQQTRDLDILIHYYQRNIEALKNCFDKIVAENDIEKSTTTTQEILSLYANTVDTYKSPSGDLLEKEVVKVGTPLPKVVKEADMPHLFYDILEDSKIASKKDDSYNFSSKLVKEVFCNCRIPVTYKDCNFSVRQILNHFIAVLDLLYGDCSTKSVEIESCIVELKQKAAELYFYSSNLTYSLTKIEDPKVTNGFKYIAKTKSELDSEYISKYSQKLINSTVELKSKFNKVLEKLLPILEFDSTTYVGAQYLNAINLCNLLTYHSYLLTNYANISCGQDVEVNSSLFVRDLKNFANCVYYTAVKKVDFSTNVINGLENFKERSFFGAIGSLLKQSPITDSYFGNKDYVDFIGTVDITLLASDAESPKPKTPLLLTGSTATTQEKPVADSESKKGTTSTDEQDTFYSTHDLDLDGKEKTASPFGQEDDIFYSTDDRKSDDEVERKPIGNEDEIPSTAFSSSPEKSKPGMSIVFKITIVFVSVLAIFALSFVGFKLYKNNSEMEDLE